VERGRTTIINSSPLQLMGHAGESRWQPPFCVCGGVPFRVGRFYMIANNGPKVSNLTVGHHSFIPSTLHQRTGCPTFYRDSAASQRVPTPNDTESLFTGLAAAVGDTLHHYTEPNGTTQHYTWLHKSSHEEHST